MNESGVGRQRQQRLAELDARFGAGLDPHTAHVLQEALVSGFRPRVEALLAQVSPHAASLAEQLPQTWWFDRRRLRVVATGFGPFLHHSSNPSWDVAEAVAEALPDGFDVRAERIDVTHRDAEQFAASVDFDAGQVLMVHFGLAARREHLSLERFAHNCRGNTPDESSNPDHLPYLKPGGPLALDTKLRLEELSARWQDDGAAEQTALQARVSRDVGNYVCNTLYYHSLAAVDAHRALGGAAEALFVHVPPMDPSRAKSVGSEFAKGLFDAILSGLER